MATTERTIGPGWTWIHHDELGSTNEELRRLAAEGAPHGTTVTARRQVAGRGRQGRPWVVPDGQAITVSILLRDLPRPALLPLAAGVAVARTVGDAARLKWPNDVVLVGRPAPDAAEEDPTALRKLAGILCEGRPDQGWAIAGIGLNVAVDLEALPPEIAATAATMGRGPEEHDAVLARLVGHLAAVVAAPPTVVLAEWSARDVLRDRTVGWVRPGTDGAPLEGTAAGIDTDGRLVVRQADGTSVALDAGEVHLVRGAGT